MLHKKWFTGLERSKWICKLFHRQFIIKGSWLHDNKGYWYEHKCKKCNNRWYELN